MPAKDIHRQLRHAAWKGDSKLAKNMLKRGAEVEGVDSELFTPLLIAARWGQLKLLKLLIEQHSASLLAKTREGDTAYNLALDYGHSDCSDWLAGKGCSTQPNPMSQGEPAEDRPASSDGNQLVAADEESRTLWVGGIPSDMAGDVTNAALSTAFERFGALAGISTRQKPGKLKSWAFVTFTEQSAADAALGADSIAVQPSGRRSKAVALQVQKSSVEQHIFLNEQKGTTGQLATVWRRRTPPQEEIDRICDEVRAKCNELRMQSGANIVRATDASTETELAPGMSAHTPAPVDGTAAAVDETLGQPTFPVTQTIVKSAPQKCNLGVGTMGLALFDGFIPIATWPYKLIISTTTAQNKKKGSELHVTVNAGKKIKRIAFGTDYSDELNDLIQSRLAGLLKSMKKDGVQDQARPFSSLRADEYMKVDGMSVPFEVASFGAKQFAHSGCTAVGGGTSGVFDAAAVKGSALVIRRRGKYDFSFVDIIERAQEAGAVAVIMVNYCDEFVVPKDSWAEVRITIPVLTLPLTIGGGMLSRHGAESVSFSFGHPSGPGLVPGSRVSETAVVLDDLEEDIEHEDDDKEDGYEACEPEPTNEHERRTIWVGQIPAAMLDVEPNAVLTKLFEKNGTIASITLRPKPGTGKSWAFVTYSTEAEATSALSNPSGFEHEGVALLVRSSSVSEHLELIRQKGALAQMWQYQMEKETVWMRSLLGGLNSQVHYQHAKEIIAKSMGLRAEELENELEDQEMEELLFASWDDQQISSQDYEAEEGAEEERGAERVRMSLAAAPTGSAGLGMPPSVAAPRPSMVGFEPEPEPEAQRVGVGVLLTRDSRGVSEDFVFTSTGVDCDV